MEDALHCSRKQEECGEQNVFIARHMKFVILIYAPVLIKIVWGNSLK